MVLRSSLSRSLPAVFLIMISVVGAGVLGCESEEEAVVVDFSEATQTPQTSKPSIDRPAIRVAVSAMTSPKETFLLYRQMLLYLGRRMNQRVEFVQRKTYKEVNELIATGQIDLAFICSGPYAAAREKYGLELLAAPQIQGRHFYHSYLIVNANSPYQCLEDLRGKTFAFTDPDSNTGKLVPVYWLAEINERPETFFSHCIYTYSHDNSIMAVSKSLVDGAAVDSLIWEYYRARKPALTLSGRVIKKSEPYGIPPIVVSQGLDQELKDSFKQELFTMHLNPEGLKILKGLMIERFIKPEDKWYDSIRRMRKELDPKTAGGNES